MPKPNLSIASTSLIPGLAVASKIAVGTQMRVLRKGMVLVKGDVAGRKAVMRNTLDISLVPEAVEIF